MFLADCFVPYPTHPHPFTSEFRYIHISREKKSLKIPEGEEEFEETRGRRRV
jgi:hypothetical protein